MQHIQELREWLRGHRALGTLIMQEGADITDAEAVAPWQDRMQAWCHSLISVVEKHDQAEAGRFDPLVRITHSNFLPSPVSNEHQMSWRCHYERLVRLDDFLYRLNKRFGIAGSEQLPRSPGTGFAAAEEQGRPEKAERPSDAEHRQESEESRREKGKQETREKYKRWYDQAQEIKKEGKWTRPTDIAAAIAKREKDVKAKGTNAANIRRRLDEHYRGWAERGQAQKTGAK